MKTITPRLVLRFGTALCLVSASLVAQDRPPGNPRAAKALARVVQDKDFGKFAFEKAQTVTVANNPKVPGLGGLAFVYYKSPDGERIMLSIQWFEDADRLRAFFDANLDAQKQRQPGLAKRKFGKSTIWANGDKTYYWTDARHVTLSGSGAPIPPDMLKAYLEAIPSREPKEGQPGDGTKRSAPERE